MRSFILFLALFLTVAITPVYASEVLGTISTGVTTGIGGTVIVAPPAPSNSGGGGTTSNSSGGGSGGGSGAGTKTVAVPTSTSTTPTPKPSVLGESVVLFTRDLAIGSKGDDVKALQAILRAEGFFTFATDTGYYGPLTATAVMKYQAKYGIIPASGKVDTVTRTKLNGEEGTAKTQTTTLTQDQKAALIMALEQQLKVLILQLAELMKKQ